MFDPTGAVRIELTSADIVPSSVQVNATPGAVTAQFTTAGGRKFCALTRALARRGARLHRVQHFAVAVGGHVVSRPFIDFRAFPKGFCAGPPDFEIDVGSRTDAERLAHAMKSSD